MIEYVCEYLPGNPPALYKQLADGSELMMRVALTHNNETELREVSSEKIREHINNYVLYIRDLASELYATPEGYNPRDGWPLAGWAKMAEANSQASHWWNYVEFRETPDDSAPPSVYVGPVVS